MNAIRLPNRSETTPFTIAPTAQPTKKIAVNNETIDFLSQSSWNCVTREKCVSSVYVHWLRLMLHLRSSLPGKVPDENKETMKTREVHMPMDSYICRTEYYLTSSSAGGKKAK